MFTERKAMTGPSYPGQRRGCDFFSEGYSPGTPLRALPGQWNLLWLQVQDRQEVLGSHAPRQPQPMRGGTWWINPPSSLALRRDLVYTTSQRPREVRLQLATMVTCWINHPFQLPVLPFLIPLFPHQHFLGSPCK